MSEEELAQRLKVPESFKSKTLEDAEVVNWNNSSQKILKSLGKKQAPNAQTIANVSQLAGREDWLAHNTSNLAQEFLGSIDISIELVKSLLETYVKPLFLTNPHPQLNLSTGRVLPRAAGGPMASQDYYEEQNWKNHPGLANTVSWCIRQIPSGSFEQLWHLLIPPVMTFLDDYQAPYKLRGVMLVSDLLESVPPSLLKRTGIAQLLMSSLSRVLMNLHDTLSPHLIRTAVPVTLRLIELTTFTGSVERFDQLSSLLGDSIIGAVWVYASRERETIEASMDVLPSLIQGLGIGTVRYLKALIPQCLHSITLNDLVPRSRSLEIAALKALLAVVQGCHPRMHRWKGTIIEGVGKYWVTSCDSQEKAEDNDIVCSLVQEIFASLSKACPSVLEEEYPHLLQMESNILQSVIAC